MKKYIKILLLIVLLCPISIKALQIDNLYSSNVLVYDVDEDKTIYEKNSSNSSSIASLTKIMTAIISLEKIEDVNKKIEITYEMLDEVPWDAATAHLNAYDTVSYKDLIYALMLPSGADAAYSLAIDLYESEEKFVDKMNEKAKELEMSNTKYVDPVGYYEGNKSNTKDLLLLIKYALKNNTFKEAFESSYYKTTNNLEFQSTLSSYGKRLNKSFNYVLGSKTGYTDEAGLCLITLSKINDEELITISLDAPVDTNKTNHLKDLDSIYTSVKDNFTKTKLYSKDETLYQIETKYAKEKTIDVKIKEDLYKFIEGEVNLERDLKVEYSGINKVKYNEELGTNIGTVYIRFKGETIKEIPVIIEEELSFSLICFVKDNIIMITVGFIALIIIYLYIYCKIKHKRLKIRKIRK